MKYMKKRYALPDSLRGLTLISMITYHTVWDMVNLFGNNWNWFEGFWAELWQQSVCWCFILLSGFCWSFGKTKWKRGLVVLMAGTLVSVVTLLFMPENRILFGVLTMLGSCMLLMIPLQKLLKNLNPYRGCLGAFLIFLYIKSIDEGYVGIGKVALIKLPENWYSRWISTYLGLPPRDFWSSDYFGLLPWIFLFITGYFLYRVFEKRQWMEILSKGRNRVLEKIGQHSLLIYMVHQPLVYGVLFLVYKIIG